MLRLVMLRRQGRRNAALEAFREVSGRILRDLSVSVESETERRIESLPKLIEEASALALVGAKEHGVRVLFRFSPGIDLVLRVRRDVEPHAPGVVTRAAGSKARSPGGDRCR